MLNSNNNFDLLLFIKTDDIKDSSLSKLHDHLADGLPVVFLPVGLVHRHTHRPGTGQAGGGQASSGETHLVRVSWRKKSKKRIMWHS